MSPLTEIFIPIPGTGARVNLMAVIVAGVLLVLLAVLFVAVLALVVARSRRDDGR